MAGLKGSRRWDVLPQDAEAASKLGNALDVPPLVARVMCARGIRDVEEAKRFLTPSLDRDWQDPLLIPGMKEAADRVEAALERGEQIAVFGDFDVDGMSATCLLTLGLRALGGKVAPFIPNRFGEGYGLSREALARVQEKASPDLIVTVDNGIAAKNEVAWLKEEGIDVVVTDHHEPGDLVPEGVAVTDPKMTEDCPSRDLAGAGVALKLVQVLGERLGNPDLWRHYTEVATLGTISDMMDLCGENRALVTDGLERMRKTDRPGIVALAASSGTDLSTVTADSLPFSLIPRLNAAGRMGSTDVAFQLLLTDDKQEATRLASQLEAINSERREIEAALTDEAMAMVDALYEGGRVIVVGGEGWHEGVKGIVASRMVNKYHVPALLFTISDGVARGSGRSVGSVDLFHAVEQCSDLLIRFGGHAGAVGVTLDAANLDAFRDRMEAIMDALPAEQFEDRGEVAAIVSLAEIDRPTISSLEILQPFGMGNKKPLFGVCGVTMRGRARVGTNGDHLRFVASDGTHAVPAIMFRTPHIEKASGYDGAVDLVFEAVNETWQGRTKPKLMVKDIIYRTPDEDSKKAEPTLADELFEHASEVLSVPEHAGIAEALKFRTRVVRMPEGTDPTRLSEGERLSVCSDGTAEMCSLALVTKEGTVLGHLRHHIAAALVPAIDAGATYRAEVLKVVCTTRSQDAAIDIQVMRQPKEVQAAASKAKGVQALRQELSGLAPEALAERLSHLFIGDHDLLPAQREALALLGAGKSCFCVMATGRGKSLIFHVHAARMALAEHKASIFVYPLRALVADQRCHLEEAFGALGMTVRILTGATGQGEREDIFAALAAGEVDVVLTTPEFLAAHARRFAKGGRIGFVVVDEAHHAGQAVPAKRDAYSDFPKILEALGHPVCLAVSATAPDPVAKELCRLLQIPKSNVLIDRTSRTNLVLDDLRELRDREAALVHIVAAGEKCVCYVNSREQSVALVRMLRHAVPDEAGRIAFYNAGLTRRDRARVERAFREGDLSCIVATSAFGEGVDIPDIRHVVLFHMPFSEIEFNQMCGRAGRDGKPAQMHLLFSSRDARIDERIIASAAPARSDLVVLYRTLKQLGRAAKAEGGDGSFDAANADIAEACLSMDDRAHIDEGSVSAGIQIFQELGFLSTSGWGSQRRILMADAPSRMDLEQSIRYLEGMRAREDFARFRDWILTATAQELTCALCRPIIPHMGRIVDGEE